MNSSNIKKFRTKRRCLTLGEKTMIVGILNMTPDSFSDGGCYSDIGKAKDHFLRMESEGATIIDIGGESTRPNHKAISSEEELSRILPFLKKIRKESDCLISIDTSKSKVAEKCLDEGADIINDVWGGQSDPNMIPIIAKYNAACFLMHNSTKSSVSEGNIIQSVSQFLHDSISLALDLGVNPESIGIDPGLGFGKLFEDNWRIMREISFLKEFQKPILLGASRKSMIAQLLEIDDPKKRIFGTLATTAWASMHDIDFVRVHDVLANLQCSRVINYCTHNEAN